MFLYGAFFSAYPKLNVYYQVWKRLQHAKTQYRIDPLLNCGFVMEEWELTDYSTLKSSLFSYTLWLPFVLLIQLSPIPCIPELQAPQTLYCWIAAGHSATYSVSRIRYLRHWIPTNTRYQPTLNTNQHWIPTNPEYQPTLNTNQHWCLTPPHMPKMLKHFIRDLISGLVSTHTVIHERYIPSKNTGSCRSFSLRGLGCSCPCR
jgi:hypothetical protein